MQNKNIKSKNTNLGKAKKAKNDEFYTQLSDIEKELWHYKEHFKWKIVFLNCDDPEGSNFFKYFVLNFDYLWLKKIISTHYHSKRPTYKLEVDKNIVVNWQIDFSLAKKKPLEKNGDFRSPECVEILEKEVDIVVTNPPFSLFREYVAQLIEYNKQFIIIGSMNAITYKEIFKLIKENKIWLGYTAPKEFVQPNWIIKKFGNIKWYTNLDIKKRQEEMILYKIYKWNENNYPKYDNYDAIEVSKVKDIPMDYEWIMGVPITFLDKYNPEQFEIVGKTNNKLHAGKYLIWNNPTAMINWKKLYHRILIKNKKPQSFNS